MIPPILPDAAGEGAAVGVCAQCAILLGFDPFLAPLLAALAVFVARLILHLVELRAKRAARPSSPLEP